MKRKVMDTIRRHGLLAPGDRVLVAVSGGADSLCLLHLLHSLSGTLGVSLHAVYVNHGLRPEARLEAQYVKKWASKLGLPFSSCRVDVRKYKKKRGLSGQDAARRLRYGVLRRVAVKAGCNLIATAHHRDDRVETLLLRLFAGSGIDGLAGFPARREIPGGLTLIRPLYDCWRGEVELYCREHGLAPVFDRSNLDQSYLRNRIRLRLLPFLERQLGPHLRSALAKTGDLLATDAGLLAQLTDRAYLEAVTNERGCPCLNLSAWHSLPGALQARLLRKLMWEAGVERPSRAHVNAVLALAVGASPSASVSLPSGVTARREYNFLRLTRYEEGGKKAHYSHPLHIPGRTLLPGGQREILAAVLPAGATGFITPDRFEAFLDFDLLDLPLVIRSRRPGDRVRLLGAPGSRKLKDILIDRKIPLAERRLLPVVASGDNIAWVAGVGIAHNFRVTTETSRILHLKIVDASNRETEKRETEKTNVSQQKTSE